MRSVVLVLFLLAAQVARADVGVVVTGDPDMQAPVMNEVQSWVQSRSHALVAAPLGSSTPSFVDCFVIDDMACAAKVFAEHSRASAVIFVRIDVTAGQSRSYTLVAHWFNKGSAPVAGKRACDACDTAALAAAVDTLLGGLAKQGGRAGGRLKVTGSPRLSVQLDGKDAGSPPFERDLPAGVHEVVFTNEGKTLDSRSIEVAEGALVEVNAPAVAASAGRKRSRTVPALLVAGGLIAAAAGGVFLYYGSLGGPDEPYVYTNATEIGLPLALAGAFAVGAGTALWFSASGETANVGVSGSF